MVETFEMMFEPFFGTWRGRSLTVVLRAGMLDDRVST